ncbi:MAG: hypothetical protein RR967_07105 [Anaerovoracaceae bacterium]
MNKRKKFKKIIGLSLAAIMAFTVMPVGDLTVLASDGRTANSTDIINRVDLLTKYSSNPFKGTADKIAKKENKNYGTGAGILHQELDIGYYKGYIYKGFQDVISKYKMSSTKETIAIKNLGDYMISNLQFYGNKVFFEGELSSGMTTQHLFSANTNGTGLRKIVTDTLDPSNAQSFTVYKGKLYGVTFSSGVHTIRSYDLNGRNKKTILKDEMTGFKAGRKHSFRGYSIYKDRIYYIKPDGKICSSDLNGKNRKVVADVTSISSDNLLSIITVYNGYIYYRDKNGVNRISTSGKNNKNILNKFCDPAELSFYGNKMAFNVESQYFGLVDTDGKNKKLFPSSYFTVPLSNYSRNIGILDSDISYLSEYTILYNNPKNKGYGQLGRSFKKYKKPPTIKSQLGTVFARGSLKEGIFYINGIGDGRYNLGISGASKANNAKTILWDVSESTNRRFMVKKIKTNEYTLTPVHSKLPLTSAGKKGSVITQSKKSNQANQVFKITYQGKGYRIQDSNGYYLGVSAGRYAKGTPIILWDKAEDSSQEFEFKYVK